MFPPRRTQVHPAESTRAFTLIELLVVMVAMLVIIGFIVPACRGTKQSGDVTKASYDMSEALESARAYAKANSNYVLVGGFEENEIIEPSAPAVAGIGRVTYSIVASKDGTCIYNADALTAINPTCLSQVGKLTRIDNAPLASLIDGTGTGTTFPTRPPVNDSAARIGDGTAPSPSLTPYYYPVGTATSKEQYAFFKTVEFSPCGEARLNNANSGYKPLIDIGLH